MTMLRSTLRWSTFIALVAALSGGGLWSVNRMQHQALHRVLGPDAELGSLKLLWKQQAGCARRVAIPLTEAGSAEASNVLGNRLTADEVWFVYDPSALIRKRLVLPQVIIKQARLSVMPLPFDVVDLRQIEQDDRWMQALRQKGQELAASDFVSSTQVSVDARMLAERWQNNFVNVRTRSQRAIAEARDIQQQLSMLDNPLRHEKQVLQSRTRLDSIGNELDAMLIEMSQIDRVLRDQQSRVRESLLIEKKSLHDQGTAFKAPAATKLAASILSHWLSSSLRIPATYSVAAGQLATQPFRSPPVIRGEDERMDGGEPDFAVTSAKAEGSIESLGDSSIARFEASGVIKRLPHAELASEYPASHGAAWSVVVTAKDCAYALRAETDPGNSKIAEVTMTSDSADKLNLCCKLIEHGLSGNGSLNLRAWLSSLPKNSLSTSAGLSKLVDDLSTEIATVPENIGFELASADGKTIVAVNEKDAAWLAEHLSKSATKIVSAQYDQAGERLDEQIKVSLDALSRDVAVARNEAVQSVKQLRNELTTIKADVIKSLQQRSATNFARTPSAETLR